MIYFPKSRLAQSYTRALAAGTVLMDEGVALVSGPNGSVKVAAGVDGEHFIGFSINQRGPLFQLPKFVQADVSAANPVIKLDRTPLGGRVIVRTPTNVVVDAAEYTYAAATNTIEGLDNGAYIVSFEYSPTMIEARVIQGDVQPGGTVPMNYDFTGVVAKGDVYTSNFEISDDWTVPGVKIRLGANGKLTTQGTGAVIDAYVIGTPNADTPFLGICVQ